MNLAVIKTYYQPKKRSRRRSSQKSPIAFRIPLLKFGLLFLVLLVFLGFLGHLYLRHKIAVLEHQKQELLLTKAKLSAKIFRLEKDPKAYEEIARRKYGLVKDNERLVVFR